ncbi:MAG: hypothetical protein HY245_11480, partial [Rhizobiales bacterium]|nr:hypothetical protein [Hyphomicrobiales bacterium]
MNIRPSKWILYAPVAALPLLAALMINGNSVQQDLLNRGEAALKAAGATWAKLSISGRDATLTGEAASDDDAKAAARVAAATHGIRLVKQAVVIKPPPPPPPPELKAPTVTAYAGESSPKTIVGTWDEGNAAGLTVAIPEAKIAAELGKDAALTSDGRGNWSLALKQDLPPGTYDVQVTETAKDGRSATHSGAKEIEVKAPPPPPELKRPTATAYAGAVSPTAITGTWDEGNAAALSVAIPDAKIAAELGKDAALSSDGKGNWSLTLAQKLAPGAYDVVAT